MDRFIAVSLEYPVTIFNFFLSAPYLGDSVARDARAGGGRRGQAGGQEGHKCWSPVPRAR